MLGFRVESTYFCLYLLVLVLLMDQKIPGTMTPGLEALSHSVNSLSFDLMRVISENESQNNIFYSPLSISAAFSMLLSGAKEETKLELFDGLKFKGKFAGQQQVHPLFKQMMASMMASSIKAEDSYILEVVNKLVVAKDYTVLSQFQENLFDNYMATIDEADFAAKGLEATDRINQWVANKTHDKIKTLLEKPLDPLTKLVLLNAIYFKGTWELQFDTHDTSPGLFKNYGVEDEANDKVEFMSATKSYRYVSNENYTLLELPYERNASLIVLLPQRDDGLDSILETLKPEVLEEGIEALTATSPLYLSLKMPKFKLETNLDMKAIMSSLGVNKVFSSSADLSGISGSPDLFVSKAVHKAFVELTEKGTEAAAATGIGITYLSAFRGVKELKVDHPFLFIIRDNESKTHLFIGKINQIN